MSLVHKKPPWSDRVTQTVILRVKEGVDLENAGSGCGGQAAEAFMQLTNTVQSQPGFVRQFWGHQVEEPQNLVWSTDWESFEASTTFSGSGAHASFVGGLSQVFDLEAAPPVTLYTRFTDGDAAPAFEAGVTEVSIYTLRTDQYTEEAKVTLEKGMDVPSMEGIKTVGRSSGGAIGWVFESHNVKVEEGHSIALHGVFGYPTVEDHVRWRASPEHAKVIEELAPLADFDLRSADLPGGGRFVPGESMFHVQFHRGT